MSEHTHGPSETDSVESLLPALIKMRDNALGVNFDPAAAVLLSHAIAWMNWAKDNAQIHAAAPDLLEELDRLTGEVRGCWGMAEQALREILGNTNYHIVEGRLESSRVAVAKALGRKP